MNVTTDFEIFIYNQYQLSIKSKKIYFYYIKSFLEFMQTTLHKKVEDTTVSDINFFVETRNLNSNKSLMVLLSAFKYLGRFIDNKFSKNKNIFLLLELPKLKNCNILPHILSVDDIEKLIASIPDDCVGIRDKAIFEIMYSCGLRISEVVSLEFNNIHLQEEYIIVTGKRNNQRIIPIGKVAIDNLEKYIKFSRKFMSKNKNSKYIFLSKQGNCISQSAVWKRLQIYKKNVELNLTPHTLRHCFASHLYQNGADLVSIKKMLGHSNLTTTTIYVHVNDKQLDKIHSKYFNR